MNCEQNKLMRRRISTITMLVLVENVMGGRDSARCICSQKPKDEFFRTILFGVVSTMQAIPGLETFGACFLEETPFGILDYILVP